MNILPSYCQRIYYEDWLMILLSKHFLGYLCKKSQFCYKMTLILLLMSSGPVVIGMDLALKNRYLKISK